MATSPIDAGGRHRKITVNERIDRILLGSLQEEDARVHGAPEDRDRARERSYQLSSLYSSSVDDKFLKTRARAARSHSRQRSVDEDERRSGAGAGSRRSIPPLEVDDSFREFPHLSSTTKLMLASPIKSVPGPVKQSKTNSDALDGSSPKKPWYNTSNHPSNSACVTMDAKVRRYGAYGIVKMLAHDTYAATSPPYKLRESQSLDSLAPQNLPSAWSSPLRGSPTLWPQDATYANGSTLPTKMLRCPSPVARFPTHSVGEVPPDERLERAKVVHKRDIRELETKFDAEKQARLHEIETNRAALEKWQQELDFKPLSSKMDHPIVRIKGKRAVKQMTILHTPQYSPESKFHDQVQQISENKFALRWRNMAILLDVMRRTPCRRPVLQDIDKLFLLAYEFAFKNANPLAISRQQFWALLQKEYPDVEIRHANRLFSSYDVGMRDAMDIRVFLGTIRALRVQQGTPLDLLCASFHDFDVTKRHAIAGVDDFVAALSICCGSDEDEREMVARATSLWTKTEADVKAQGHWYKHRGYLDDDAASLASVRSEVSDDGGGNDAASELQLATEGRVSIKHARAAIKRERKLLQLFTELLLKRREECFNVMIPPSR